MALTPPIKHSDYAMSPYELKRAALDLASDYDDLLISWHNLRRQLDSARDEIERLTQLAEGSQYQKAHAE